MRLIEIVSTSDFVASTRRRTEKIELLAECLKKVSEPEIEIAACYLAGQMRQGRIGVGWGSLKRTFETPPAGHPSLALLEVDRTLEAIAEAKGSGSAKHRATVLAALLARATSAEQDYLRRLLIGELRQGALESLVLDAIASAAAVPVSEVRRAQMLAADLGRIAKTALLEGRAGLARFDLLPFVPVQPMLAQTTSSVEEALERFRPAAFEVKLDGARVQIHKSGGEVRIYSRLLNDVTPRVPELVEAVRGLPADELILDGEAIALAPDGAPLPFQVTMRRFGRKLEVDAMRAQLPLRLFVFDCLRAGRTLIDLPLRERMAAMDAVLPPELEVERRITEDPAAAAELLRDVLERGHEGLMAKSLDALYEAGSRGASWLKLKLAHTLDLVVLAAEWGSGRRQGWLSNLHLGARDEASGQLVMLGKTFKGMTDEMLAWQTQRFLEIEDHREGHIVWVRPEVVVEVAIGGVQSSSQYPGGVALRFARVKRYRNDKSASAADTLASVQALNAEQGRVP